MTLSADDEKRLNKMNPAAARANLGTQLVDVLDRINAVEQAVAATHLKNAFLLTAPTLMIKAAASKLVKSGAAFSALVGGVVVAKSANTDMPMPLGTVAAGKFAAWAFDMPSTGTIVVSTKTADQDAAEDAVAAIPALAANHVRLGYIVLENGSAANWVGNTDNLDAADIAITYVNAVPVPAYSV